MANNDPWAEFTPLRAPAQKGGRSVGGLAPYETNVAKDIAKKPRRPASRRARLAFSAFLALNSLQAGRRAAAVGSFPTRKPRGAIRRRKIIDRRSRRDTQSRRAGKDTQLRNGQESDRMAGRKGGEAWRDRKGRRVRSPENKLYEAQTRPGKFVETGLEFATSASQPGGRLNNMVRYGVVPGVVSETAGQPTEGTPYEKWARLGGALAGGGGVGARLPSFFRWVHCHQATEGMTAAQIAATEQLFQEPLPSASRSRAQRRRSRHERRNRLADFAARDRGQRLPKGEMAARPAQIGGRRARCYGQARACSAKPSQIGPAAGEAASGIIGDTQAAINAQTRPLYNQVEQARVGFPVSQALAGRSAVRGNFAGNPGNPAQSTDRTSSR